MRERCWPAPARCHAMFARNGLRAALLMRCGRPRTACMHACTDAAAAGAHRPATRRLASLAAVPSRAGGQGRANVRCATGSLPTAARALGNGLSAMREVRCATGHRQLHHVRCNGFSAMREVRCASLVARCETFAAQRSVARCEDVRGATRGRALRDRDRCLLARVSAFRTALGAQLRVVRAATNGPEAAATRACSNERPACRRDSCAQQRSLGARPRVGRAATIACRAAARRARSNDRLARGRASGAQQRFGRHAMAAPAAEGALPAREHSNDCYPRAMSGVRDRCWGYTLREGPLGPSRDCGSGSGSDPARLPAAPAAAPARLPAAPPAASPPARRATRGTSRAPRAMSPSWRRRARRAGPRRCSS